MDALASEAGGEKLKDYKEFVDLMIKCFLSVDTIKNYILMTQNWNKIDGISKGKICKNYQDIFQRWNQIHTRYTDDFEDKGVFVKDGKTVLLSETNRRIELMEPNLLKQIEFYKAHDLNFGVENKRWNVVIMNNFWNTLKASCYSMSDFIGFYYNNLLKGRFKVNETHDVRFGNRHMSINFFGLEILCGTYLERVPVFRTDKELPEPPRYEYRQVLKLYRIITEDFNNYKYGYLRKKRDNTLNHKNKGKPFLGGAVFENFMTDHLQYYERFIFDLREGEGRKVYAKTITKEDEEYMKIGNSIWVPVEVTFKSSKAVDNKVAIDEDARFMMAREKNQSMVIDFFETLQDYGIKFSPNQRQMLVSNVNTLVLGRSGTGKTTISAFKILALDLLFMSYKKNFIHGEGTFKLNFQDFKEL